VNLLSLSSIALHDIQDGMHTLIIFFKKTQANAPDRPDFYLIGKMS
jgi:hypothetical protein